MLGTQRQPTLTCSIGFAEPSQPLYAFTGRCSWSGLRVMSSCHNISYARFQHARLVLFRTSLVISQRSGCIPPHIMCALLTRAAQPAAFVPLYQACVLIDRVQIVGMLYPQPVCVQWGVVHQCRTVVPPCPTRAMIQSRRANYAPCCICLHVCCVI